MDKKNITILPCISAKKWEQWLAKNHSKSEGIWLQIYKKDSAIKTITYAEALDEALCYGWIDGQKNAHDLLSWIQRFTPRRTKSIWSKRNREHILRLTKQKRMKPRGLQEVASARKDGRWDAAYDSPRDAKVPDDFLALLHKNKKAETFFKTLNKSNLYSVIWRLQTAKRPETRARRMVKIIEQLTHGKKVI